MFTVELFYVPLLTCWKSLNPSSCLAAVVGTLLNMSSKALLEPAGAADTASMLSKSCTGATGAAALGAVKPEGPFKPKP